jgi:ketosteroid isomerase-like protein
MSVETVETVRALWEPWADGRLEEFSRFLAEDIEWDLSEHPLPDFPNTGSGRDAFLGHLVEYVDGWVDYRTELGELIDVDDEVIAVVHEWARMRDTGVDLDRDIAVVWTVRDGLITRFRVFKTTTAALEGIGAAGDGAPSG